MPNHKTPLLIGLAGALALSTANGALAASKKPSRAVLNAQASTSTENAMPNSQVPVVSYQMSGYRPGYCHILVNKGLELGYWDKCPAGRKNPGP
jgi:hypothetical protein